ncbi:hypothetical protein D7030_07435 [Flavobacteriaceae bacterium AU392]|nr:hypothetical protein D1817_00985 [Flavobacteriaceae bacterium]RKM84956.1 hypothetical protein D7030_07435 [Flavobacteriaceae bacterium AU392]
MKTYYNYQFLIIFSFLLFINCNSNEADIFESSFNEELGILNELRIDIQTLAQTSTCDSNTECRFINLGNKPCGGPETYIIYSTSIDTEKLEQMVVSFNLKQRIFNDRWQPLSSNCTSPKLPIGFNCERNTCTPIF